MARLGQPVSTGRVLAVVLVTCGLVGVLNLAFTGLLFREFCGVIVAQTEVYAETPPSSPTGVRLAETWRELRGRVCRE